MHTIALVQLSIQNFAASVPRNVPSSRGAEPPRSALNDQALEEPAPGGSRSERSPGGPKIWLASCFALLLGIVLPPAGLAQQSGRDAEAVSPLGRLLYAKTPAEAPALFQSLEAARQRVASQGGRPSRDALLELGQALDAVWKYREAVSVYSTGLSRLGRDGEFFLRRGLSSLRLRNVERALEDLRQAVRFNQGSFEARYRLGLAYFVDGEFRRAFRTLEEARALASTDDEQAAALSWSYLSARRAGRRDDAEEVLRTIPPSLDLEAAGPYPRLLQMFLGRVGESAVYDQDAPPEERGSTEGFGVACLHLYTNSEERAEELLGLVVAGPDWPAIGVIAAESDLARLRR